MECKILKCKCQHEFQDKIYGKGNRLCNPLEKTSNSYRCTVCNNVIKI